MNACKSFRLILFLKIYFTECRIWQIYLFSTLKLTLHCLHAIIGFDKVSATYYLHFSVIYLFLFLDAFKIFFLFLVLSSVILIWPGVFFFMFHMVRISCILGSIDYIFFTISGKFQSLFLQNNFLFTLPQQHQRLIIQVWGHLKCFHTV